MKILSLLDLVFAVVYVAQITSNYYLQMTAISQSISMGLLDGTTLFSFGNFNSIFWSMEVLGYTWLSASLISWDYYSPVEKLKLQLNAFL
jgi:hypothetical protein